MRNNRMPFMTTILVAANIIIFFVLSMFGMTEDTMFMLDHGAMYVPYIVNFHDYSMLFTSMFLHFGFSHLINNMIVLFFLGSVLEKEIGKWKYLFLYFLSGLCGNLLSAAVELWTGKFYVSAGASGAIFGIIGALLFITMKNHGHLRTLSQRGLVFMVICSLYHGFTSTGVDNMAHVGGLISGFIIAAFIYRKHYDSDGSYIHVKSVEKL